VSFALRTARLLLRDWRDDDLEPFAAMAQDPAVIRHLRPIDRAGSDAMARMVRAHAAAHGFCLWAVEIPDAAPFIGYVGLQRVAFDSHFTPAVEIGWRLASAHWGRGYATEAACAARDAGFDRFGLDAIVSFTVPANVASERVMQRIGMTRDPADDFAHPRIPAGHPLSPHILYRLRRADWRPAAISA
jgi:ribosomal-protein-alanine N-acetyltransferase